MTRICEESDDNSNNMIVVGPHRALSSLHKDIVGPWAIVRPRYRSGELWPLGRQYLSVGMTMPYVALQNHVIVIIMQIFMNNNQRCLTHESLFEVVYDIKLRF